MENNIKTHFTDKFGLVNPSLGKSNYRIGYESGFIDGTKWQAERILTFLNNEDYHTEGELGNSCIDVETLVNFINKVV